MPPPVVNITDFPLCLCLDLVVCILLLLAEWTVLPCTESCSLPMEKYLDFHIILIKPVLILVSGVANRVTASLVTGCLKCLPVGTGVIAILRYAREVFDEVMLKALTGSWILESLDVEHTDLEQHLKLLSNVYS